MKPYALKNSKKYQKKVVQKTGNIAYMLHVFSSVPKLGFYLAKAWI